MLSFSPNAWIVLVLLLLRFDPAGAWQVNGIADIGSRCNMQGVEIALKHIVYPNKAQVAEHVENLAQYMRNTWVFRKYIWRARSGLFSYATKDVTDIDMYFGSWHKKRTPMYNKRLHIPLQDFEALLAYCLSKLALGNILLALKIQAGGIDLYSGQPGAGDLQEIRALFSNHDVELAVVSIAYKVPDNTNLPCAGWVIPMDVAISCTLPFRKWKRRQKFFQNMRQGNYAKGLTRFRGLLECDDRLFFSKMWAEKGGKLRFLVKQLDMLHGLELALQDRPVDDDLRRFLHTYLSSRLLLQPVQDAKDDPRTLDCILLYRQITKLELQRRSRSFLLKCLAEWGSYALVVENRNAELMELIKQDSNLQGVPLGEQNVTNGERFHGN